MLRTITPETVRRAIDLAEKFDVAERKRDDNSGDEIDDALLSVHSELDEYWALYGFVSHLNDAGLAELKAVMWLGRGDDFGEADPWSAALKHAHDRTDESSVAYIMGKSPLAKYLTDGLKTIGS